MALPDDPQDRFALGARRAAVCGARTISEPSPVSAIASLMYCTSLTLVSRCSSGVYQRYSSRASSHCPAVARSQSARFSCGNALTSPEIQPCAPSSTLSSTRSSTPAKRMKRSPHDVDQVGDAADVLRRFLDRDDVRHVRQFARTPPACTSTPYETGLL